MAGSWQVYPRSIEGIEILDDGTIKLSALRAQATADGGLTYKVAYDTMGNPKHILSITPKKIRMTVAVPLDHSIIGAYKLATDPTPNIPTGPSGAADSADMERGVRQHYTKSGDTYKRYLRKGSFPTPETVLNPDGSATVQAIDKLGADGNVSQAVRDDTELLRAKAFRKLGDLGRVQGKKSIFLKGVVVSWKPGDFVHDIGGVRVNKVVEEVILHCGESGQKTELVMG